MPAAREGVGVGSKEPCQVRAQGSAGACASLASGLADVN